MRFWKSARTWVGPPSPWAWACRPPDRGVHIHTVEYGGSFKDHPSLPSDDIIKDLKKNLVKRGVDGIVTVLQGMSDDRAITAEVNRLYAPGSVGLLALDADGGVARDLKLYGHLLREDCLLVVDDYYGPADLAKVAPTRLGGGRACRARRGGGMFGLYGWGTWIGQRVPGVPARRVMPKPRRRRSKPR